MQILPYIFLGWLLSFLGQLPLGTMSITATQIAVQENFRQAWKYSLGVALVEIIYLRGVLSGMQWIVSHQDLFKIFNWLTVLLFGLFGIWSFITAQKQQNERKALLLDNRLDRFLLGLSMSALNPVQIPFWFVWSGYFLSQGWLKSDPFIFNVFTFGTGLGTICGLMVYMYGGKGLVTRMKTSNRSLNKIMGLIFIMAALAQLYRILWP